MTHPELGEDNLGNPKLVIVANMVQRIVHEYDIKQSDPLEASKYGRGNCVAKAAISAVLLERAKFVGTMPALAWNRNTHPKHGQDLFGKPKILNGHAYLLVTSTLQPYTVSGISFNPDSIADNSWEIFQFNEEVEYATVDASSEIVATEAGKAVGYEINDWHQGGRTYSEALGITDSVYHQTTIENLSAQIIESLVERDLLSKFG